MFQENLSSHSLLPYPAREIMLVPRKPVGFSAEQTRHKHKMSETAVSTSSSKKRINIKRRPVGAGFPQWFNDQIKLPTSATFPESFAILGKFDSPRPLRREISVPRVPVPSRRTLLEQWSFETFELNLSSFSEHSTQAV